MIIGSRALIKNIERVLEVLGNSREMVVTLVSDAAELGGEWDQEISTDLVDVSHRIEELIDDVNIILAEARIVQMRTREDEASISDEDEELNKFEAERIKEELEEKR